MGLKFLLPQLPTAGQQEQIQLLEMVVKGLAGKFVIVLDQQLAVFLLDRKYGSPPTKVNQQHMAHCQLTNLVGEACFVELDCTIFKNWHASLHHHSTLNMMKQNETVSKWLNSKPEAEKNEAVLNGQS